MPNSHRLATSSALIEFIGHPFILKNDRHSIGCPSDLLFKHLMDTSRLADVCVCVSQNSSADGEHVSRSVTPNSLRGLFVCRKFLDPLPSTSSGGKGNLGENGHVLVLSRSTASPSGKRRNCGRFVSCRVRRSQFTGFCSRATNCAICRHRWRRLPSRRSLVIDLPVEVT
jgi:hypothetical protein